MKGRKVELYALACCCIEVTNMGLEHGSDKRRPPGESESPTTFPAETPPVEIDSSLPKNPRSYVLEQYLIRVRAVAEEIAKICAKNEISSVELGDRGFNLKLNRTANQINETGALVLHINNSQIGGVSFNRVELITPIGAICCFQPVAELSSSTVTEIENRFGLSEKEVAPCSRLVQHDVEGVEFAKEWRPTSPGDFKNGTEFAQYSWIFS